MLITNNPQTEIARIFMDPNIKLPDNRRPLLYLIRRDLQNQYGKESENSQQVVSPLLTSLGIMIGIELLTKYWSGDHEAGTSKIEEFLQTISSLSKQKAIALAQFRHAIAHGYRLQTTRKKDQQTYIFSLSDDQEATECIVEKSSLNFLVNLWKLKGLFLESIKNCRSILEASTDHQAKFMIVKSYIKDIEIIL